MTTGYSGTPLSKKLGFKPAMRVCFLQVPQGYADLLGILPDGVTIVEQLEPKLDLIQVFIRQRIEFEAIFDDLKQALVPTGMLWVCWIKKTAKIPTDVTEDVIREMTLARGLVDVKVCAIDTTWSGLKLVYRLKDRPGQG